MKLIFLIFLITSSLFSYDRIKHEGIIDDYRIYGPIRDNPVVNDSTVVVFYHQVDDTLKILDHIYKRKSPIALANFNINSQSVEFYYDRQNDSIKYFYYYDALLAKNKEKLFAFKSSQWISHGDYFDSVEVFNTSNGEIDKIFRIDSMKIANFNNMYNGNLSFMAIKENKTDKSYYHYEIYIEELNPDNYSYKLTRAPRIFEKLGDLESKPYLSTSYANILKSHRPGVEKEVILYCDVFNYMVGKDKYYYTEICFEFNDSLQFMNWPESLWRTDIDEQRTRYDLTLNEDSLFIINSKIATYEYPFYTNYQKEMYIGYPDGYDDNYNYLFFYGITDDFQSYYFLIYNYLFEITIDSIEISDYKFHPFYNRKEINFENFYPTSESNGIIIFRGSIWKFNLSSSYPNRKDKSAKMLNLYPNPFENEFIIEFEQDINDRIIEDIFIVDVVGRKVEIVDYNIERKKLIIRTEDIIPGTYYLKYYNQTRVLFKN